MINMNPHEIDISAIQVLNGDLTPEAYQSIKTAGLVAWDIETSGLDWRTDQIATCQLYVPGGDIYIVRIQGKPQNFLPELLEDSAVLKIFHHAMFDLIGLNHYLG